MNNIDILEEFLDYYSFLKTAIGGDDIREFEIKISKNEIKAISNLIAENKELKENSISKSKVQGLIDEINKAYENSKDEYGESEYYYPDYTIEKLQSLLGKE